MAKRENVECEVRAAKVVNDNGIEVDGVIVACSKCGKEVESCGTHSRSVRRCLALMRENCELDEDNYYVALGGEDRD
jgi:hypothetical protein